MNDVAAPLTVHPFAARFPMLEEDDLDELAASIKENGLRHPIVMSPEGELIDGRNRLEACRRAGVEPTFEVVDADPVPLILDQNVRRRHLNRSQQAVAVAMAYPDPEKGGRGKKATVSVEFEGVHTTTLAHARLVLKYTPTVAELVLAGKRSLDLAYKDALAIKDREATVEGRIEKLKAAAPDLASQVADETLTLAEAEAALIARQEEVRRAKEAAVASAQQLATNHVRALNLIGSHRPAKEAVRELRAHDCVPDELTPEACRELSDYLRAMATALGKTDGD